MPAILMDFGAAESVQTGLVLRDYQVLAVSKVREGWATFSRQGLDIPTGGGKTEIAMVLITEECAAGGKVLVLENRDALVRQTADRIRKATGLEVDIEMAGEHASPFAQVVVASVPSLQREGRLTGFADNHFSLQIVDETQHVLSNSYQRVVCYFHYGQESIREGWIAPSDGTYTPKARILGVSATWELSGKRNLADLYQSIAYSYQFWEAVNDGWLVQPVAIMEPLAIDFKGLRVTRTSHGSDYNPTEVAERMIPVIEALAKLIVKVASERKTMAFMPSVNTAALLAQAINRNGLKSIFVSGECLDRGPKTDEFVGHGPGVVLTTSAMYIEGWDCPDVDCVFAGITKSVSYYKQKIGRATRPLKGVVDGLATPEERKAAIAASAKKDFLIIDPFFKCDDISLCDVYWLYSDKEEVRDKMKVAGAPSKEAAEKAERDFIKALEKEARKHERKAAKVVDPLALAVQFGDETIRNYVPTKPWEMNKPNPGQLDFLRRQHIDTTLITTRGLAQKIVGIMMMRLQLKLARPLQLDFLKTLGVATDPKMTAEEAAAAIDENLEDRKNAPMHEKMLEEFLTFIGSGKIAARVAWRILARFAKAAELVT